MDHRSADVVLKRVGFLHFYVEPQQVFGDRLMLTGEEAHHALHVMRKRVGEPLTAVDGCGGIYDGIVEKADKGKVWVRVLRSERNIGEPRLRLTLAQAVPKGQAFDWVVEKGTELGVAVFQPMITERSLVEPEGRLERWRHKALAAMKQCGRSVLPEIGPPLPFMKLLNDLPEASFIAHEAETNLLSVGRGLINVDSVVVFIGPEGGFSDGELRAAVERGVQPVSLGVRRLRSETAALTAIIKILSAAGEL